MRSFTAYLQGTSGALVEAQIVQAPKGMSLYAIFDEIYGLDTEGRLRTGALIVRLPVDEPWSLQELYQKDTVRARDLFHPPEDLFRRMLGRSLHILTSSNGQHLLSDNLNPDWRYNLLAEADISSSQAIEQIRHAEFENMLEHSRAILTCPAGSRFRAPSGNFLQSFVRVGNIQNDRDAIDAVFFWLLPHLVGVGAILTDTWSISSIAFNVARLAGAYFGGVPRVVEFLTSYNDGSNGALASARGIVDRLGRDHVVSGSTLDRLLCIISATQTGSLAKHLRLIFETSSTRLKPSFVALFALGDTSLTTLHDLHEDPRFQLLPEVEGQPITSIGIDEQVYFPLQFEDAIIKVNKAIADRSRAFFDRYVGTNLIKVHKTGGEVGRQRHHGIYLETEVLLRSEVFLDRFEKCLDNLPTLPQVIVCPPHPAGEALASYAAQYFSNKGVRVPIYIHPTLYFGAELGPEERELFQVLQSVEESGSLLIIGDVSITGTRLAQYQRYIRTARYRGRIDYLVAIARPPSAKVWSNLERTLRPRSGGLVHHTLSYVEMILLPDWREADCPWCRERNLYSLWLGQDAELPTLLLERLERLSAATGLGDGLYLQYAESPPFALGPTSLFASETANQAEVFTAVSAALQQLRTSPIPPHPALGTRRFPLSTVLDYTDYACQTWTDSVLRVAFLRAAMPQELIYADPAAEAKRSESLADLVKAKGEGEHEVALEVLLATNLGQCSLYVDLQLSQILQGYGEPETSIFLIEKCRFVAPLANPT